MHVGRVVRVRLAMNTRGKVMNKSMSTIVKRSMSMMASIRMRARKSSIKRKSRSFSIGAVRRNNL
jgi:hypothetical protein